MSHQDSSQTLRQWRTERLGLLKQSPEYRALDPVLKRLVDYLVRRREGRDGKGIFESQSNIAAHFGWRRETANRYLRAIAQAGVFTVEIRTRGKGTKGGRSTNVYRVNSELLDERQITQPITQPVTQPLTQPVTQPVTAEALTSTLKHEQSEPPKGTMKHEHVEDADVQQHVSPPLGSGSETAVARSGSFDPSHIEKHNNGKPQNSTEAQQAYDATKARHTHEREERERDQAHTIENPSSGVPPGVTLPPGVQEQLERVAAERGFASILAMIEHDTGWTPPSEETKT